ncbi:MAG TPA: hypothetical protein VG937_10535 [Polyangiaceae bacterium]|nr:hypothetical protein [Polyangiaceae bacterium]
MHQLDLPIEADLRDVLAIPPCEYLKIPSPKPLKIQLPSGGSLPSLADLSKGIPTDCAYSFNLMIMVAPLLASMECLLKILKLLKPLISLIKDLPKPPTPALIKEFGDAAIDLAPCLLIPTPANIIPFVRDLLCLLIKLLNCFLGQMKTVIGVMKGLTLKLDAARSSGNLDLVKTLECSQENAQLMAEHFTKGIEPIGVILELAGTLFGFAGVPAVTMPPLAAPGDLAAMEQTVQTIQGVVATMQTVVDALGGCQS